MGMTKDLAIEMHELKQHVNVLNEEILDTLAQLRHNIRYSGADDNRTLYNRLRYTVHPHYCSATINPPCLICKVDDLVEQWLTAQGQLWAIGGEQSDWREEWATAYSDKRLDWLANQNAFIEADNG
jgi:hypothetical protein